MLVYTVGSSGAGIAFSRAFNFTKFAHTIAIVIIIAAAKTLTILQNPIVYLLGMNSMESRGRVTLDLRPTFFVLAA